MSWELALRSKMLGWKVEEKASKQDVADLLMGWAGSGRGGGGE